MPLPLDLSTTTARHLAELIDARESESGHIDFKRELPTRDARGTNDLIADVSAFANSSGGDLIYGVDEDGTGLAASVVPQTGNMDEEVRRIQDVLMHNIEPRIPGVQVHAVGLDLGFVLIIRVPQSWAGPHRVRSNFQFYTREGARKRPLDLPEVRSLFLRSNQQAKRIRDFRTERLGKILAGDVPQRLSPGALLVAHFVPTQSVFGSVIVDPIPYMRERTLPVFGRNLPRARINADGAIVVRNPGPAGTHGYSQLFRDGCFESVQVFEYTEHQRAVLGSSIYEQNFIDLLQSLRAEYAYLGIGMETTCLVSILGADHLEIGLNRWDYDLEDHQGHFDRATLVLPEVLLPSDRSPAVALKPVFDLVWQSAGMEGSANYNVRGEWAPPRR